MMHNTIDYMASNVWQDMRYGSDRESQRPGAFTKRIFDSFGFLSDRLPSQHRKKLKLLADEIVDNKVTTVIVIGHAFGSTMERKYTLGFRRALRLSRRLHDLIKLRESSLVQFPRILIASLGDTFPQMGATQAQDRRVDVIFRRRVK